MDKRINSDEDLKIYENEKHFKVFAGPGAGKTHLIIENIKYIVQNSQKLKSDLRKILCITYTNIAANEIKNRLNNYNQYANVSTIHGFLNQNVIKVYQKQLKIIIKELYGFDIPDELEMVIRREGDSIIANTSINEIKDWINSKNRIEKYQVDRLSKDKVIKCVLSLDTINKYPFVNIGKIPFWSDNKKPFMSEKLSILVKKYLWEVQGVLDFDEILYFSYKLLEKFPFIKYNLGYKFPYVFIDEQQDTNPLQYQIIKMIFDTEHNTVGFIGDTAQSIYSFQGANYKMMKSEHFKSKETLSYVIDGNRRSTKNIINFCNYIRKVDSTLSKQNCELNFENNSKVKIIIRTNNINNTFLKNYVDDETYVLCRRFIDLFLYVDIDDYEQKDALTWLYREYSNSSKRDLITDFENEIYEWIKAVKFVCNMYIGISKNDFPYLIENICKYIDLKPLKKPNEQQLKYYNEFLILIKNIKEILKKQDRMFFDIVEEIDNLFDTSLFNYVNKIYDPENENLESHSKFIEKLTLKTIFEVGIKIFINSGKYKTIHKSKGKEYKKVLVHLMSSEINEEKYVKAINVVSNPVIYSEEEGNSVINEFHRIFYVAISRAIDELTVILDGSKEEAFMLEKKLNQYCIDENIEDKFYELEII